MISRRLLMQLLVASGLAQATLACDLFHDAAQAQTPAQAQNWPNRHVRLIVPFPAGGGADAIARIVAARLSEIWGQQVLIENRGGASGNLAAEATARAAPDGYTLFLAGDFHSVNLFMYPKLSYDPVADFAPVSLVVLYPSAMVVPNTSPARTVGEFIAHAKASKEKLSFASPGHGTSPHLAGELFKRTAGIELTVIPYRGAAPAIQDLLPGRVDVLFNNIAPMLSLMQQGQLRVLAVTTGKRTPAAPDVPTLAEAGVPGFDARRHRGRAGRACDQAAAGRPRPFRGWLHAGRTRKISQSGNGQVGTSDQGSRHQHPGMSIDRRKLLRTGTAAGLLSALPAPVRAQTQTQAPWPTRFVRLIVPFAAGGANEAFARNLAARLSEIWGQQVVIENKPGAGGNIGADAAARAEPDGHTMLIASFPHAVARFLYPSLSYDLVDSFAPVTLIGLTPNIMVVPNSSPARSVAEFIAHAKASKLTFASSGLGTSIHLSGELFKRVAGIDMTHVPYRGGAPAVADLIPGRVDLMFNVMSSVLPQVRAGQMRGLAVTTAKRVSAAPEFPTFAEAGLPGFEVTGWFGFLVPAKTPPEIAAKIHADTARALADPTLRGRLEELGIVVVGSTPAELAAFLKAEMEKWGPVIKEAGIRGAD